MKSLIVKRMLLGMLCVCLACTLAASLTTAKTAHAAANISCNETLNWYTADGDQTWYAGDPASIAYTSACYGIELVYQFDGNFVLYYNGGGAHGLYPIWATGTNSSITKAYKAVFQQDGNLVVYAYVPYCPGCTYYYTKAIWASGTNGKGATRMSLQSDGNLVIYKDSTPLWATGTNYY